VSRLVTKKRSLFGSVVLVATVAGSLAVTSVGHDEGLRLQTYKDIVGVPTFCYGETQGAKMGQTYTKEQCDALLLKRLDEFAGKVEACIKKPMSDKTLVAFTSFSYNVGSGGACKSTAFRLYNAGDFAGGCRAMGYWNKARGRVIPGLTARRARETKMCLEGLK
jgi:lysozyme